MVRKNESNLRRYDLARGSRGKHLDKARRSFETIVIDKKVVQVLGGPEGLTSILEALAKAVTQAKKKRRIVYHGLADRPGRRSRPQQRLGAPRSDRLTPVQ